MISISGLDSNDTNLGDLYFFEDLRNWLKTRNAIVTRENLYARFQERLNNGRSSSGGAIDFLFLIEALVEEKTGEVSPSAEFLLIEAGEKFQEYLLSQIFCYLGDVCNAEGGEEHFFSQIFSEGSVSYPETKREPAVSAISFHPYSAFRHLLLELNFFSSRTRGHKYVLNKRYFEYVSNFMPWLNLPSGEMEGLSLEDFKKRQERKEKWGEDAEKFVLEYEKQRLGKNDILQMSLVNVGAGYDILSYHSSSDTSHNRHIEVKSYDGDAGGATPYFYLTENEKKVAQEMKNNYVLYLVDRAKVGEEEPSNCIIQVRNPYEKIIENSDSWNISIMKKITYRITKKNVLEQ